MFENKYNKLAWLRGLEKGNLHLGKDIWIGPFCVVDGEYDTVWIGDGVNISSGAQILTHDTVKRCLTSRKNNKIDHAPTVIEHNVYIGTNAVILKGAIIGHHSIIAAGCVVKENFEVPPYSLVAGVPGKIKRSIINEFEKWSNENSF
jgi:acetyltransferase-like isoleucine patch superfamily enzyme